jgi:hypothetical protein
MSWRLPPIGARIITTATGDGAAVEDQVFVVEIDPA